MGMFFAELGANVTKIENRSTNGDVTRSWKLPSEKKESEISAYFCAVNWNKKYLFKNLKEAKDLESIQLLIKDADIVILNFKKGDDLKFGLDYKTLSKNNPKLIYGTINGFGEKSDRVAYDLILQAETGFMSMNGTSNSGPVKMPVALIDILAGHQLKEGILVAIIDRFTTGKGKKVSVSLYDSAVASLANQATNWLMADHVAKPIGSTHPNIAPYGELFKTIDGATITFAIGSNKQFVNLCKVLELNHVSSNLLYKNNMSRVKNRLSLADFISEKVSALDSKLLLENLHSNFVPAAKIKNIQEVFESTSANDLILKESINGQLTKRVKTVIFKS